MGSQNSHSASLQQIDKEIEIANAEYTDLKDKLNTAMNIGEGGSNFKQTMFGQPDYTPEPSGRLMIILLSGASAFILTCLVFIFIQYFDPSIKAPSQFQRQTGLKLLGTINWVPVKKKRISEQVIVDNENDESEVRRNNSFRELLRKLRFEIENSGKRVLLFTSTEPQQGKTTLAQAVAFSLSQGRKKVLIVDTNFCNNDITVYNDAQPTLENFSNSGDELKKEDLMSLISKTDVNEVDLIGCKGGDYTPSEILPKNHLLNYIKDVLKYYDFVILEGAPLNGYTDSKELVQYVEGVIAIFSAQSEIKQVDKESIKFLKDLKGKFLGGVLNKVEVPNINA
jgi:polysaccharide biosynthesis transport protein